MLYCDLEDTGRTFKSKKIYKCTKCGLEAGLEDPNANILCFEKTNEAAIADIAESERIVRKAQEEDEELKKQHNNIGDNHGYPDSFDHRDAASPEPVRKIDTATEQQINERMDICNSCEYYKDESCMLCGCRVVRNSVYQNKLADKNASCPDGRWKAIED